MFTRCTGSLLVFEGKDRHGKASLPQDRVAKVVSTRAEDTHVSSHHLAQLTFFSPSLSRARLMHVTCVHTTHLSKNFSEGWEFPMNKCTEDNRGSEEEKRKSHLRVRDDKGISFKSSTVQPNIEGHHNESDNSGEASHRNGEGEITITEESEDIGCHSTR